MLPQGVLGSTLLCFPIRQVSFHAAKCTYTGILTPARCARVKLSAAQVLCQVLYPGTARISGTQSGAQLQMHFVPPELLCLQRRFWIRSLVPSGTSDIQNSYAYRQSGLHMHQHRPCYLLINFLALFPQSCWPVKWEPTPAQQRAQFIWKGKEQSSEMWPMVLLQKTN